MSTSIRPTDVVHPYVERRPDVQGGSPVIRDTRFPVTSIVLYHRRGLAVDEILQEFPSLTPAQVYDALSYYYYYYYYDHQDELERELDELTDFPRARENFPPTRSGANDGD